jgi:signal transduction histidine kinase
MSEELPFNEQEVSDLDTARLALRGAVSTLRTMQDLIANLKAENQELTVREKAWKARVETMEQRLAEIHAKWQESQKLIQDYRQEIAVQLRHEIAVEEQEKWRSQIEQVQRTLLEWQKTRELREAELGRVKEMLTERDQEVWRLEQEKIAFEHKTQAEIASLLDKSRQALKDAVQDAVEEKNQELREVKTQWLHETEELKDALRRVEMEMKLKEEESQKEYHQKRRELEALWRRREEEAWKQAEGVRVQTEAALQTQLQARLETLAKEREDQRVDYQHRLEALENQRLEQQKTLESVFQVKEAEARDRYLADLRVKEEQFQAQRIELEQQTARREAEMLVRVRKEEEILRHSLRELEAELKKTVDEEMARRQIALLKEIAREKEALEARAAEERKTLEQERDRHKQEAANKAQDALAEKLAAMETVFVERRAALEEDVRKRQADLETRSALRDAEQREAWIHKESELHDKYHVLIKDEQAKMQAHLEDHKKQLEEDYAKRAEAELRHGTEALAAQRKFWEQDLKDKQLLLEAQYKQRQGELEQEWKREETEIHNQMALEARTREADFEEKTRKRAQAEITRITQDLQERQSREMETRQEELERERQHVVERQAALQEEYKKERARLHADLEKEKQIWLAEREHQAQELSLEKQRLEQYLTDRQAHFAKQRDAESAALREDVMRKQEEWLKEHQSALQKTEAALRREVAQKEETLRTQYQSQLVENVGQNNRLLEDHRKSLAAQYEQAKAALLGETLKKEKDLAAQLLEREKALTEKYQQATAAERTSALAQVRKALESAEEARQALETSLEEKRAALEAKYRNEAAQEIQNKEREMKERAERRIIEEIARRTRALEERAAHEKSFQGSDSKHKLEELARERIKLEESMAAREKQLRRAQEAMEDEKKGLLKRLAALEKDLAAKPHVKEAPAAPVADPARSFHEDILGDLVFGIAHQIRNPLAVIRSATESLMETQSGPSGKQPYQAILNSAGLLQDRLEQLIEFTKPVERGHEFTAAHDSVRQVEKVLSARCRTQRVKVEVSVPPRLPPLAISQDHLLSIVLHLATNGLDAMERGGTLSITGKHIEEQQKVELQIADTGHGISASDLKEMGRPFFTTRAGKVGLGVAIAKRLAQAYGGDVIYESRMGKGTTVCVRLPLERGSSAHA